MEESFPQPSPRVLRRPIWLPVAAALHAHTGALPWKSPLLPQGLAFGELTTICLNGHN